MEIAQKFALPMGLSMQLRIACLQRAKVQYFKLRDLITFVVQAML